MSRRNRSRSQHSSARPFVLLLGVVVVLAVVVLLVWPRRSVRKTQGSNTPEKSAAARGGEPALARRAPSPANVAPPAPRTGVLKGYHGRVNGPLPSSMRKALGREKAMFLSALAARLLLWRLNLRRDLRRGDKIRILYEPIEEQSRFRILAMTYKSLKKRKTFQFYRYKEKGRPFAAYYNEEGVDIEPQLRHAPLRSYEQITSVIKMRRKHKGIDFKVPVGYKVYLPFRGRVERKNWNFRYNGNCLKVALLGRHRGVKALFLHLKEVLPVAKPGAVLKAGTVIALSGNSGRSTAPHLHYQLERTSGKVINPFTYHETYRRKVASSEKADFVRERDRLKRSLATLTATE